MCGIMELPIVIKAHIIKPVQVYFSASRLLLIHDKSYVLINLDI
jgi:hypothetical protein